MSRPLARSALKLLSLSFLITLNITAESKGFIFLEKYLSQIEIVSNPEDRKIGLMYRKNLPYLAFCITSLMLIKLPT